MMRRPKRTNWHSKTAGGWPETAFHCCSIVLPHTRGRPVSWVAHRQLGSCLPPIRHLLKLIHRRVLINSCWLLGSKMASMEERERYRERDKRRKREIELLCKEGGGFMTGDCSPRTLAMKCSRYQRIDSNLLFNFSVLIGVQPIKIGHLIKKFNKFYSLSSSVTLSPPNDLPNSCEPPLQLPTPAPLQGLLSRSRSNNTPPDSSSNATFSHCVLNKVSLSLSVLDLIELGLEFVCPQFHSIKIFNPKFGFLLVWIRILILMMKSVD